jgi:DNA-binding PadR family transcriptional regulator
MVISIEANTDGKVNMGPGTLYGSIKRMLKAGFIHESDERPDPDLDELSRSALLTRWLCCR